MPPASLRTGLALATAALLALPALGLARDPVLVYTPMESATALHDQLGENTLRQAPVLPDRRWPSSRLVAKVSGKEMAGLSADQITARLRSAWRDPNAGGRVAVDEISPSHWQEAAAEQLRTAMTRLSASDRRRVTFYAAPAMVEQVGRTDPRAALSAQLAILVDAMSLGRSTYLLTYRGNLQPFPAKEMASHPTRWVARWPANRGTLHLMLGPDGGIGQTALWERVRASAAGRDLLANGPAAYGVTTASSGSGWAREYQRFLAAPTAPPPAGDFPLPVPGGLGLTPQGAGGVLVTAARAGRVVITIARLPNGPRRAIKKLVAPREILVTMPTDVGPGRYRVEAVLQGDGLVDRAVLDVTVSRPAVRMSYRGRLFTLTVPRGARAVLSVTRAGKRRTLGKVTGPTVRRIRLPKSFPRGRYTAVLSTSGTGGQKITRRILVR